MPDFLAAREQIHASLREELVGPAQSASRQELDTTQPISFPSWEAARGAWKDKLTQEEILSEVTPLRRYGVGVLHPAVADWQQRSEETDLRVEVPGLGVQAVDEPRVADALRDNLQGASAEEDADDLDLTLANNRQPSSMGVSCRVELPEGAELLVEAQLGRYRKVDVKIGDTVRTWFVRQPVRVFVAFSAAAVNRSTARRKIDPAGRALVVNGEDLNLEVGLYSREVNGARLVTVTLTNRTQRRGDTACVFQANLHVSLSEGARILPYPERAAEQSWDDEERSIALLYRRHQTFGIGHGCAADWEREPGESTTWLSGVCLPSFEAPSVTPDVLRADGSVLRVDMRELARPLRPEGVQQVKDLIDGYENWISDRSAEAALLPERHLAAAAQHLQECGAALKRMRRGWGLVQTDPQVQLAFQLANQAMVWQQARSAAPNRVTSVDPTGLVTVAGSLPTNDLPPARGFWRPFQIAFILASLESVSNASSEDRDLVDLIFFPTGGGKTEAYLGLAAFAMLIRRLRDPLDVGTEVLMRYTLRLLTAQQFLRAAALICALERIRADRSDLGTDSQARFSIGIWLGGSTTPNKQSQAVEVWNALAKNPALAANKFLLLRCPWCGAQTGPTDDQRRQRRGKDKGPVVIPGYLKKRDRVSLTCPDRRCEFHKGLPLYVVDEDIYEERPSMVIGTVDKFAMLPWRPQARSIFGIGGDGHRDSSPPGLIIQDEFHLISGPLGSMVGLYESVIEDLCTDHRAPAPVLPKIVASTATIRRYREQAYAIYARDRVALFPPQGLDAEDAYFAVWARGQQGQLLPGRRYIGVHAPSLGSQQTVQVRVGAALTLAPMRVDADVRDPWWTTLWFFNSLRELGNTLSLLQSDIPDYLLGMQMRDGLEKDKMRYPSDVMELTSRRRNDEIPKAIEELQRRYTPTARDVVDVCLASNIIEVGVDIDRLSLMTIVGQPKTTAQYIQVSGRVGRSWQERPGLVCTLYGGSKPRDRSHFERFRSYHERLYAQVEPTSVTPFAKPVLKRALRAALVAHVRLNAEAGLPSWPYPSDRVDEAGALLLARAGRVDPAELAAATAMLEVVKRQWSQWDRAEWEANSPGGDPLNGLMRYAGTKAPAGASSPSWEIPASMRSVDAECRVAVTAAYHAAEAEVEEP